MDSKIDLKELAGRIYDLDAKVYKALGSSMGHVFYGNRDDCIHEMLTLMQERKNANALRSDLALIGNMARSLKGQPEYKALMVEYNEILQDLKKLPTGFGENGIIDRKLARLNEADPRKRFAPGDHLVICISRAYGCSGSNIGFQLADLLRINYYDVEILEKEDEAQRLEKEDKSSDVSRYHGLPKRDALFFTQSQKIRELARKEDLVIMGRCADAILARSGIPHVSIFITAPMEQRIRHALQTGRDKDRKKVLKQLKAQDKWHRKYYRFYTGRSWGDVSGYDLCINSAVYGIEGSVGLILRLLPESFRCVREAKAKIEADSDPAEN